jgi:hypothetical protein
MAMNLHDLLNADADTSQAADIVALLKRISEQLDALPARIAASAQRERHALASADRQALAGLVRTVAAGRLASTVFTAGEALAHVNAEATPDVQAALVAVIGALDSATAPRRLGKLFGRAEGVVIDGLHIGRSVEVRDGFLWQLTRV